jgi:acetyl-CoA acetyltransferase
VAQRHGATLNPLSVNGRRGEITIDDVMASRPIAEPLKLLDCCLVNQGAGCIVMTSTADAKARHHPVVLLGWGEGQSYLDPCSAPSLASFEGGRLAADTAFGSAGITRDEIDVAGISDHSTINVIVELEASGFCAEGEGGRFVEGQATRIGGRLPVNTDGGFLSASHAGSCGVFTVIELVRQLRGEAGPRQVESASLAYAHGVGGVSQVQYGAVLARA